MPRWLSVVTTALSLTVLLVCFSLEMTSLRVDRYACMGCQSGPAGHGTSYFPTYKAAACHYARSRTCNQSKRGIRLVTIQSRPSDRDVGGGGASGAWPPARPNPPGSGMLYTSEVICLLQNIPPFFPDIPPFPAIKGGISRKIGYIGPFFDPRTGKPAIVRSFVLILTRNNGSELKTSAGEG